MSTDRRLRNTGPNVRLLAPPLHFGVKKESEITVNARSEFIKNQEVFSEMEHFIKILTKPDNIPIAIMFPLIVFFVWLAISQGLRHDKLNKEGKKDAIYDEMIR